MEGYMLRTCMWLVQETMGCLTKIYIAYKDKGILT